LHGIPKDDPDVDKAIAALAEAFPVKSIDDVYGNVKQIQAKTDLTKIRYTEEL